MSAITTSNSISELNGRASNGRVDAVVPEE
jgi:hypothetical protein